MIELNICTNFDSNYIQDVLAIHTGTILIVFTVELLSRISE